MKTGTALFIKGLLAGESVTVVTSGTAVSIYALRSIADDIDLSTRQKARISISQQRLEILCGQSETGTPRKMAVAAFVSIHDVYRLRGASGKIYAQNKSILNKLEYEGYRHVEIWPDNYPAI